MPNEPQNMCPEPPPFFRRLESVNDDLHVLRRLMEKPGECMFVPEIMDMMRMALAYTHDRYESLAREMRTTET